MILALILLKKYFQKGTCTSIDGLQVLGNKHEHRKKQGKIKIFFARKKNWLCGSVRRSLTQLLRLFGPPQRLPQETEEITICFSCSRVSKGFTIIPSEKSLLVLFPFTSPSAHSAQYNKFKKFLIH